MSDIELWTPVVIRHHGEAFEKDVYENYEVSCRCRIRNAKTKKVLSNKIDYVGLLGGGTRKMLCRYRICKASFYPDEIPEDIDNYDVDHIKQLVGIGLNILINLIFFFLLLHEIQSHRIPSRHRQRL